MEFDRLSNITGNGYWRLPINLANQSQRFPNDLTLQKQAFRECMIEYLTRIGVDRSDVFAIADVETAKLR